MQYYVFNPEDEPPLRYVHPVKVKKVAALLNQNMPGFVKKVYLFGSSLNLTCRTESDIDLYFVTDGADDEASYKLHCFCRVMGSNFDLLVSPEEEFDNFKSRLNTVEREVNESGLCIYEKQ
jgi:hypothetical protein